MTVPRKKSIESSKFEKICLKLKKNREEYKEVCDTHLERKTILTDQLKQAEKTELKRNYEVFQQQKRVQFF